MPKSEQNFLDFLLGCTRIFAVLTINEICERKNYHYRTIKDIKNTHSG